MRIGDFRGFFLKWRNPHLKWRFLHLKWRLLHFAVKIVVLAKFQKFWFKKVGSGIFGYLRDFSDFFPKWRNLHLKWRNLHFEKKSPMNKRF